ncbi:hypothetical protein DMUE_5264 [Dictyocoela muelleri]|nr:hypothetical protein DMUE_5264 [Dictyocoela muelleri]
MPKRHYRDFSILLLQDSILEFVLNLTEKKIISKTKILSELNSGCTTTLSTIEVDEIGHIGSNEDTSYEDITEGSHGSMFNDTREIKDAVSKEVIFAYMTVLLILGLNRCARTRRRRVRAQRGRRVWQNSSFLNLMVYLKK